MESNRLPHGVALPIEAHYKRIADLESAVRLLSEEVNGLRDRVASLEAVNDEKWKHL